MNEKMTKVQRNTVIVAILTSVITTFMGSATNLAIPNMSADLGVGAAAIGWVVGDWRTGSAGKKSW